LVSKVNDLWVLVTSNLDWSDHTYKICKKANKMLGLLRRCTLEFHNPQTRRLLYLTIVRSNFSYASQLWSPQKVELIQEMEKVQRRASKFILNLNYLSEIPYIKKDYCHFEYYQFPTGLNCSICFSCSRWYMVWYLYRLASALQFTLQGDVHVVPQTMVGNWLWKSVERYQNSYFIRVTKLWNILPNVLTLENQTLSYFKKSLYSYYNKALKDIYDIDDNRTWKSVCIKCKNARLLNEVPHCCF
jgi:hypothetical protein